MNHSHQRRIIQHLIGSDHTLSKITSSHSSQITNLQQQNILLATNKISHTHQPTNSLVIRHQRDLYEGHYDSIEIEDSCKEQSQGQESLMIDVQCNGENGDLGEIEQRIDNCGNGCGGYESLGLGLSLPALYYSFEICVDIGDGRLGSILVNEQTDPYKEAKDFCERYQLEEYIVPILGQSIFQQKENQRKAIYEQVRMRVGELAHVSPKKEVLLSLADKNGNDQARNFQIGIFQIENVTEKAYIWGYEDLERLNSSKKKSKKHSIDIAQIEEYCPGKSSQIKKCGADRILMNKCRAKKSQCGTVRSKVCPSMNLSKISHTVQSIFHPSINEISKEIVEKIGKQNIIQRKLSKSREKINNLKREFQSQMDRQMQECVFKPQINKMTKKIDRTSNGNQQLNFEQTQKLKVYVCNGARISQDKMFLLKSSGKKGLDKFQEQVKIQQQTQYGIYQKEVCKKRTNRHQKLYQNWKVLAKRKEQSRRNSIEKIKFKPQINDISRRIVERLHDNSMSGSRVESRQRQSNNVKGGSGSRVSTSGCWQPANRHRNANNNAKDNSSNSNLKYRKSHRNSQQDINKTCSNSNSKTSLNSKQYPQLRTIPIGQQLYTQAVRLQKKKQHKYQQQQQRANSASRVQILAHSTQIIENLRQNRLRQIFNGLRKGIVLRYEDLDWEIMDEVELLFEPVFREMKEIGVQLNEDEFVKAGWRLLRQMPQDQKGLLLKSNKQNANSKCQQIQQSLGINRNSGQMVKENSMYKNQDIYTRGQLYKKSIKEQIQKGKEDRVRSELRQCTFVPGINRNYVPSQG